MTIEELSVRLEKVERQNRRFKRWGGVALMAIAGLAATGPAGGSAKVYQAEQYDLLDGEGKVRAKFGMSGEGQPGLVFCEKDGAVRVALGLGGGLPSVQLIDRDGTLRAGLGLTSTGPSVFVHGEDGVTSAVMTVPPLLPPVVSLQDGKGMTRVWMRLKGGGSPEISLHDKDGNVIEKLPK